MDSSGLESNPERLFIREGDASWHKPLLHISMADMLHTNTFIARIVQLYFRRSTGIFFIYWAFGFLSESSQEFVRNRSVFSQVSAGGFARSVLYNRGHLRSLGVACRGCGSTFRAKTFRARQNDFYVRDVGGSAWRRASCVPAEFANAQKPRK